MKKTKIKVPLVAVIWRDAMHAMHPTKQNINPPEVVDCGFIVKETKDYLVLVRQFFDDGYPRHAMTIPKGMLKKVIKVGTLTLPESFESGPKLEDTRDQ